MPRLGDGNSGGGGGGDRPSGGGNGAAMAYPNTRRTSLFQILSILVFIGILKNIFFTDYRSVEINYLRSAGKTEEEINQLVPKTPSERAEMRRSQLSEFQQLKADIVQLQEEVKNLQAKVFSDVEEEKGEVVEADKTDKAVDKDTKQKKKHKEHKKVDTADMVAEAEEKR